MIKNKLLITFKVSSKENKSSERMIVCNVRVNGSSAVFSTGLKCLKSEWVSGQPTSVSVSKKLNAIVLELTEYAESLVLKREILEAASLIKQCMVLNEKTKTLAEVRGFAYAKDIFLKKYQELYLCGLGSLGMLKKYKTLMMHLSDYLKYKGLDVDKCLLTDITKKDISEIERFCKVNLKHSHNTAKVILSRLNFFFKFCIEQELLVNNIFLGYNFPKIQYKEPIFLSEDKVKRLTYYVFADDYLSKVRDMFLFQSYTGLAYCDLVNLKEGLHKIIEIKDDKNFKFWIKGNRQKSKTIFNVPLLPQAMSIIQKYNGVANFPILTNQKYNFNLKIIKNILGFDEYLTTHVARKTCGYFLLNRGASYEVVASILGHSDIRITQRTYAKVLTKRISKEVQAVREQDENLIIMPSLAELNEYKKNNFLIK